MSLINQMLKDLERRGARTADAEMITTTQLGTIATPQLSQLPLTTLRFPLFKAGGLIVLLAGGAYLWMQSTLAQSHNSDIDKVITTNITPTPITHAKSAITVEEKTTPSTTPIDSAIESPPLFETQLKYNPSDTQPVERKIQKAKVLANLMQETAPMKPAASIDPVVLGSPVEPEKSPILERTVKPLNKSNTDNIAIGKQIGPEQKSGNYYRLALSNIQQGRVSEAQANLTLALEANPANQEARQTLAGLLLDNKRYGEAKATLAAGLAITPEQSEFRIALARLQIEDSDTAAAINTLEQGLSYAKNNAEYHGFLATLLQRANRHEEAINQYTMALTLNSSAADALSANTTTSALIGLGISLQAVGKFEKSQEAFMRVQSSATLSPELSMFVDQRIKQINQHLSN
jgi:MSHA biogenesis protein MshN